MANLFDHPCYRWNKIFLSCLGIWPEQSLFMRCLIPFFLSALEIHIATLEVINYLENPTYGHYITVNRMPNLIVFNGSVILSCKNMKFIAVIIAKIIRLLDLRQDIDRFLELLPPILVVGVALTQLLNFGFNHKKFCALLDHISSDWKCLGGSTDIAIIHEYAARGCAITKIYSSWMYAACLFYITMPVIMPVGIEFLAPLNESREKIYLFEAEYGVNPDDFYPLIFAHQVIVTTTAIIMIISSDTFFFVMIEHACALFEIVGVNLKKIHGNQITGNNSVKDNSNQIIGHCVDLHQEAISFAGLIESSYTASLVVVIGVCLLILSITELQTLMHLYEPGQVLRFGSFSIAQVFRLYLNSIPGQKVLDYSMSVFDNAYSVDWHYLTPRAQKHLILIMIRSLRPCQITAGKMYTVSMENFSKVMQTSMSYFTVLSSMR